MKKQLTKIEKLITIYGNTPTDAAKRRIMYLIAEYGNSRELEGQRTLLNRLKETKDLSEMQADYWLSTTDMAERKLESQKEKTQ